MKYVIYINGGYAGYCGYIADNERGYTPCSDLAKVYDTYEDARKAKASLNGCWPCLIICETGGNDNE